MTDSDHSSGNNVGDTDDSLTVREMIEQAGEESVFRNRNLVEPDTIIDRDRIVGRDDQLRTVVSNLRKVLNENRPPNLLLYGPAGTGKSLIFDAVARQIRDIS
ncbi:AAA family ATPase (plasmid) [Haloarcula sp. NS06]